jgi:phage shock protein A
MADNSIDLVVSKEAFDQLERLLAEIKKADLAIEALNTNAGKNPTTPSGGEANAAENSKIIAQMKELTAEINKQAEAATKLAAARKNTSKGVTQESVDLTLLNQRKRESYKETSKEADAYQKLDAQYKQSVKNAQDLGAKYGENSKKFLEAANAAKELDTRLKAIDGAVGKYGRNVGNYASGWNGLANSVNQLTREAPAFANSLQTGFMALSNNIPILADEINNLKIKNQELAASGKPTQSVLGSLTSALFSWQTALSVGVTLLTVYGAQLWEMAFGATEAEKKQQKLNDAIAESMVSVDKQAFSLRALVSVVEDESKANSTRKQAYDDIAKVLPGLSSMTYNQAIATGELTEATNLYIESEIKRVQIESEIEEISKQQTELDNKRKQSLWSRMNLEEKATLALSLGNKNVTKGLARTIVERDALEQKDIDSRKKALQQKIGLQEEERSLLNKYAETPKKIKDTSKKDEEDRLKLQEEANIRRYNALLSSLQREKEISKDSLDFFEGGIDEKIRLSILLARDEINIANIVFREKERLAKGDVDLITVAINEKATAEENAAQANLKRVEKYYEEYAKLAQEYYEKNPPLFLETKQQKSDREKQEAENKKRLEDSANYMKSFIADFASSSNFEGVLHLFDGPNSLFERIKKGSAFTKESWKEDTVAMMEAAQEMYNFIANASQQNFDAEYERLDKQKEVALQFAGESASAREKVEEDYEAKKKEIVNRENKAKKKQAIFNIGIDTAQAILSALATIPPPANIPFSIAVGLLGAAQMAVVAAQKIPQYFDGTDNHPGGLALINDGKGANYKETVVTPDGKVRQFSGRDVMIDAPAGTQVFTHDQWNNELNTMMREKGISMSNSFQSKSGLSYQEMDSIIAKHFSKITTQSTVIDRNGFNTFVSNGTSKTIRNQSRYSGTGFAV